MLKLLSLTPVIVGLLSSSAIAGSFVLAEVDAAHVERISYTAAPVTADWSGGFLGAIASFTSGTQAENYYANSEEFFDLTYDLEGTVYSGFTGFNLQSGSFVYGLEVGYIASGLDSTGWTAAGYFGYPDIYDLHYKNLIDLKARVGFATGNVLLFAFVGGTTAQFEYSEGGVTFPESYTATGINYGGGVDLLVSDKFLLGVEYIIRDLSGEYDREDWTLGDINIQTVQVRAGVTF